MSRNPSFVFVMQDAGGNNVVDETNPFWQGKLKKGTYTIIAGLMRNAARYPNSSVTFEIHMKYVPD